MARRIHCKRSRRAELSPPDLSEQTARPDTRRGRSQGIDGLEAGGADGPHRVTRLAARHLSYGREIRHRRHRSDRPAGFGNLILVGLSYELLPMS